MSKPKVYIASCIRHATRWNTVAKNWASHLNVVSSWHRTFVEDPSEANLVRMLDLWKKNIQDIKEADFLLLVQENSDKLRGAQVELGIAIALGKRCIMAVEDPWQKGSHGVLCIHVDGYHAGLVLIDKLGHPDAG